VFTAVLLFANLPDANEFNLKVERIFLESDIMPIGNEIRLLEVLANSGTAFSEVLSSYRYIIFTLVIFAMTLLLSTMVFIVLIITLNKKLLYVERAGININSVIINRDKNLVYINDLEFNLTEALFEAIAVLCEARMDDDYLSGVDIESIITGKTITDCEEAAGATRIKRLRDSLGNQIVSELLIRNISGKGYMLSIDKSVIEII
tara:strand:+ start:740 stop:1354 length:615 start_codon:yes stop_codon:yes gene_type:complete